MVDSNATLTLRGGTTAEHSTYTGPAKEVTVDTTDNRLVVHDGTTAGGVPVARLAEPMLGVNATPDATNRLSVNSAAVLLNNVGAGVQVKVNKAAAGDTASFLFQTGFSGRAEIGTTGDNDFHFKVSPDGSTFYEALILAAASGLITLPIGQLKFPAVQNPSSDANTLDDYEEGTWTPALKFGGGNTGMTASLAAGKYTKIGNRVFGSAYIVLTAKGSSTGAATITGLPFTNDALQAGAFLVTSYGNMSGMSTLIGYISGGATEITLGNTSATGFLAISETNFTDTTILFFTFNYNV
jgi:hypothetical protein